MSPAQKAGRLDQVAEQVDTARQLVADSGPARTGLEPPELVELDGMLATIVERLRSIAASTVHQNSDGAR